MREIKFRAIHKLTFKKWYEDDLYFHDGNWFEDYRALEDHFPINLEQCAVMQYTGLKDKYGTEIYEGDILEGPHDCGPGGFIKTTGIVKYDLIKGYQLHYFLLNETEVIGNIYEHSHLLKE